MDIEILSRNMALKQKIVKPTLVMRIFDGFCGEIQCYFAAPNFNTDNVVYIGEYGFCDIDPVRFVEMAYPDEMLDEYSGYDGIGITNDIAKEICEDFIEHGSDIEQLIVHCRAGVGRSPAVAAALNDTFGLGNDDIKELYPLHNKFVYYMVMRAARVCPKSKII